MKEETKYEEETTTQRTNPRYVYKKRGKGFALLSRVDAKLLTRQIVGIVT